MLGRLPLRTLSRVMSNAHGSRGSIADLSGLASSGMAQDKGKGRASEDEEDRPVIPDQPRQSEDGRAGPSTPLTSALEEALTTPLSPVSVSSSLGSSFDTSTPISRPPEAHHATAVRPRPPRLLSQLTRSTMPNSTSKYANTERRVTYGGMPTSGESSQRLRATPTTALSDDPYPDLDPTTGLPPACTSSTNSNSSVPSLHLQRTISDLVQSPVQEPNSYLPFNFAMPRVQLPSLPNLPGLPSLDMKRTDSARSISSSASQKDWSSWATDWWSGNKGKVDKMLDEGDRADTVEEEVEKHRRKCESDLRGVKYCQRGDLLMMHKIAHRRTLWYFAMVYWVSIILVQLVYHRQPVSSIFLTT